jgi:hypothetical protein
MGKFDLLRATQGFGSRSRLWERPYDIQAVAGVAPESALTAPDKDAFQKHGRRCLSPCVEVLGDSGFEGFSLKRARSMEPPALKMPPWD